MSNTSPGHLVPGHVTEILVQLNEVLGITRHSTDPCVDMLRKGIEYLIECLEDCLLNQQASYYYNFIERSVRQIYTIERMTYGRFLADEIDPNTDQLISVLNKVAMVLHNAHMEISTQIMEQCTTIDVKVRELPPL